MGSGLGQHPKYLEPLRISAAVDASNFKFGSLHNLGLGSISSSKLSVLDPPTHFMPTHAHALWIAGEGDFNIS